MAGRMGWVVGIRTGSGISDVQYIREWGEVGWGRVTRRWLAWGVLAGQAGGRGVGPDWGRLLGPGG